MKKFFKVIIMVALVALFLSPMPHICWALTAIIRVASAIAAITISYNTFVKAEKEYQDELV